MYVFAQDMEIRNWLKILLASTPLPPFTTTKKTWSQHFAIFFLKCIFNSWKRRMPKPNHCYPKYGDWRLGQGNASVCSLAPPPCSHLRAPRKNDKRYSKKNWKRFHLQYLQMKKKHQRLINSLPNMEVQKFKKKFLASM
jgi:hypothetical protein